MREWRTSSIVSNGVFSNKNSNREIQLKIEHLLDTLAAFVISYRHSPFASHDVCRQLWNDLLLVFFLLLSFPTY